MTSLAVIFILLLCASLNNAHQEGETVRNSMLAEVQKELKSFLSGGIEVKSDPKDPLGLLILVPEDLLAFPLDRADISYSGEAFLRAFIPRLAKTICSARFAHEINSIVVEGHTDSSGTAEHNWDLSQRRSMSVVRTSLAVLAVADTVARAVGLPAPPFRERQGQRGAGKQSQREGKCPPEQARRVQDQSPLFRAEAPVGNARSEGIMIEEATCGNHKISLDELRLLITQTHENMRTFVASLDGREGSSHLPNLAAAVDKIGTAFPRRPPNDPRYGTEWKALASRKKKGPRSGHRQVPLLGAANRHERPFPRLCVEFGNEADLTAARGPRPLLPCHMGRRTGRAPGGRCDKGLRQAVRGGEPGDRQVEIEPERPFRRARPRDARQGLCRSGQEPSFFPRRVVSSIPNPPLHGKPWKRPLPYAAISSANPRVPC